MRERRANAEREKAVNGSLRVDIMRNRGEGSWGGKRSEDWCRGETRMGGVIYEEESIATER